MRAVVLVLVVCWCSLAAAADTATKGKTLAKEAVERYDAVVDHRGIVAKLWDLTGNSVYKNVQSARADFDEMRADFTKAVDDLATNKPDGSEFEVDKRLGIMQKSVQRLDQELATYQTDSAAIVWKLKLALGALVAAVIGAFIWSRRKKPMRPPQYGQR